MQDVLFFESFRFCSRDDLEHLQPLSQSLLDMIVNGAKVLPLRPIYHVCMDYDDDAKDKIQIFVEDEEDADEFAPDYEASIHDGDFAETFRRLQHTCVKSLHVGVRDSPFLRYWKAQETSFTVVSIDFGLPGTTDYDVLDSIVDLLRPRTTEVVVEESSWHDNGYKSEYPALLARDSLLNNLQTCRLEVWDGGFPSFAFFLKEPGYPSYELRCHD